MKLHQRFFFRITAPSVAAILSIVGCSGIEAADDESIANSEEPIIGGVDARSPTLNAVGTLVYIYRSGCKDPYSCGGYGGSGGVSEVGGEAGMLGEPIQLHHRATLDDRLKSAATGGSPATGGISGKGGTGSTTGGISGKGGTGSTTGGISGKGGMGGTTGGIGGKGGTGGTTGGIGGKGGTGGASSVSYQPICTGTLVGPTAVLTAKHCVQDLDYSGSLEVGFAVGPDATKPTKVYPIVDWDFESRVPADYNSWLSDLGSDVGIAHLGAAVTEVAPMVIGTVTDGDIGRRFTALGYGIQNNDGQSDTRKAGSLTLRGIGGNYADYAFGGLDGFLKVAPTMPDFQGLPENYLIQIYAELGLLPEYQAFLGGRPGDAQPCFGDSGGPLIAMRNGVRTVFGNVTSGFASSRLICDYGAVFAVYGPLTMAYLEESLKWVDPCEGLTVKGQCDGDLAIRCTDRNEGARRRTETDCGLIGQICGYDAANSAVCVDPPL